MSQTCKHCHRCKGGCVDVCKCCGKCNTCGQIAGPIIAPQTPVFVPYPVYPPPVNPMPFDFGPVWIADTLPQQYGSTITISGPLKSNAGAAVPEMKFLGTFTTGCAHSSSSH